MGVGRHLRIVCNQHHRDAFGIELLEHPKDFHARTRIEVAGRLVGQEQGRMIDQGPGDGHALLLAARHLRRLVIAPFGKPNQFQQTLGALPRLRGARVARGVGQGHEHVLGGRRPRQQIEVLENESQFRRPHQGPLIGRQIAHFLAVEPVAAGTRPVEAAENVHERCLAGARHAHQRHHLAAGDAQGNAAENRDVNCAQMIRLRDVFQAKQFHGQSALPRARSIKPVNDAKEISHLPGVCPAVLVANSLLPATGHQTPMSPVTEDVLVCGVFW